MSVKHANMRSARTTRFENEDINPFEFDFPLFLKRNPYFQEVHDNIRDSSVGIATDYGLDVPGSNPGGD